MLIFILFPISGFILLWVVLVIRILRRFSAATRATDAASVGVHPIPKPGLNLSAIAAIRPHTAHHSSKCMVCLGAVKHGEVVRQLPNCSHVFHVECIDMWLQYHATCPVCRADAEPLASEEVVATSPDTGENVKERSWRVWWRRLPTGSSVQGDEEMSSGSNISNT